MTTDNQGNGFILSKCFTMKQPAASVLMCMSKLCLDSRCSPLVQWRPREENTWTDQLSNGATDAFAQNERVVVDLSYLDRINMRVAAASYGVRSKTQRARPG